MIVPKKLMQGDTIRVIAPARSLALISDESKTIAIKRLNEQGYTVTFSEHANESDEFMSSSISSRVEDLHAAFNDPTVKAVLTVIGGYNANQLLDYLDFNLIKNNPKILCGFSDITILANAINARSNLITYVGPHFSSWGMLHGFEYSLDYFTRCCTSDKPFDIEPPSQWSDDAWYINQEARQFEKYEGYWILQKGDAQGKIVGGHMRCINALQGTQYWNKLDNSILCIEEDAETTPQLLDRGIQSIIHQPDFGGVKALLIGKFQKESKISREILEKIIFSKKELSNMPIIANMPFGHTTPMITLPIGGNMQVSAKEDAQLTITSH